MSRINILDTVLDSVCNFSQDLALIQTPDLSNNTGIEIDELTESLVELSNRGYINNYNNGSYITLKGRMALENAKNGKPFKEELENKRLKKYWSITKIIAGVLNAVAIIVIAFWAQINSNGNTKLEDEIKNLKNEQKIERTEQLYHIDSLQTILKELNNKKSLDTIIVRKNNK